MTLCQRCGIGHRAPEGLCDWCAAPARARVPLWTLGRPRLQHSQFAATLRRRGPLMTGVVVGVILSLAIAGLGVASGLPQLWQVGFFWSDQWWWALVPEAAQPWLFAAARGIAYGALAGWVAGSPRVQVLKHSNVQALRSFPMVLSPVVMTAVAAFLVSLGDPQFGTQYSFMAAALGAAVGRLTTLMLRGSRD